MENEKMSVEQLIAEYKEDVARLVRYIPWLESKKGIDVASSYSGDQSSESSLVFPVYDGTLMSFVKESKNTKLMNHNYAYSYSRYHLRTTEDEWKAIEKATIKEFDLLKGIFSKYILQGMTKSRMWIEGVENKIFLNLLLKMKEIIEFWDKPLV
ncbi:MAG TPA: hypothetical protein VJZ04_09835 [Lachnospiraceae bacterium]|nr:hypothetical protein [Lachnospiraceae bacterium]